MPIRGPSATSKQPPLISQERGGLGRLQERTQRRGRDAAAFQLPSPFFSDCMHLRDRDGKSHRGAADARSNSNSSSASVISVEPSIGAKESELLTNQELALSFRSAQQPGDARALDGWSAGRATLKINVPCLLNERQKEGGKGGGEKKESGERIRGERGKRAARVFFFVSASAPWLHSSIAGRRSGIDL